MMESEATRPWLDPFLALWHDLQAVMPRLAAALAVLLAGLALAWALATLALAAFKVLNLDHRFNGLWVQRFWARGVGGKPSQALSRFVFYCALAFAALLAVRVLGVGLGEAVIQSLQTLMPRIVTFLMVLFLGSLLANFLAVLAQAVLAGAGAQHPHLVGKLVAWVTMGVSLLFSLEQLGLAGQFLTHLVLIASAGLALAFGLGCKDLAREFVVEMMKEDQPKDEGKD